MFRQYLLPLVAICAVMYYANPAQCSVTTVQSTVVNVRLALTMTKATYGEREPVIVRVTLANLSKKTQRLVEADSWSLPTVEFRVSKITGEGTMPLRQSASRLALPRDVGREFAPGECRFDEAILDAYLPSDILEGTYAVQAVYSVPEDLPDVWHGSITTPRATFTVVKSAPSESAGARVFAELSDLPWEPPSKTRALELATILHGLREPSKGGLYAQYAGFKEAMAYHLAGDTTRYVSALRDYVRDHSDVPYFGRQAKRLLISALFYELKDYAGARGIALSLPDSYERTNWLRRCDGKLAEKQPQSSTPPASSSAP